MHEPASINVHARPSTYFSSSTPARMAKFDPYEHLNIKLNPDGSLTRLVKLPVKEANQDPVPGQQTISKDVSVNPHTKTWVRLYRPVAAPPDQEMPIIVYFHGGGWVLFNANDDVAHTQCSQLSSYISSVVINVDFRLAPENRLPAQYEDAMDVLRWVRDQAVDPKGEPWLRNYADFSRSFLTGCSNGGNIVYHAGMRALEADLRPVNIQGLVMNQPMFGGTRRTASELRYFTDQLLPIPVLDMMWELTLPKGANRDHRYANPMMDEAQRQKIGKLPKCLVIGFGGDPMVDRQQDFVQMLVQGGVNVEACFDDVGFHGVEIIDPKRANIIFSIIKDFIRG